MWVKGKVHFLQPLLRVDRDAGLTSRTPWGFLPVLPWRCGIELSVSVAFLVEFHSKQTLNQGVVCLFVLLSKVTSGQKSGWEESQIEEHTQVLYLVTSHSDWHCSPEGAGVDRQLGP